MCVYDEHPGAHQAILLKAFKYRAFMSGIWKVWPIARPPSFYDEQVTRHFDQNKTNASELNKVQIIQ